MARKQFQALFKEVYTAEATLDLAANVSQDITVTGAAVGDFVLCSTGLDTANAMVNANVTAANTVSVVCDTDIASTDFKVVVLHPDFNN